MNEQRITVPLSREEYNILRKAAHLQLRQPRDQARYLLRLGLGIAAPPDALSTNATNPVAQVSEANATGFAQSNL